MKKIYRIAVPLALLLTACGSSISGVARVGDTVITTQTYTQQLAFFDSVERIKNPPAEGDPLPDLTDVTMDTLVYEALVSEEMAGRQSEIDTAYQKRRQEIIDQLGGMEAYTAQLKGYQLTEEAFESSLRRQVTTDLHYEQFVAAHQPSTEELQAYADKRGDQVKLVDFTEVVVPTQTESDSLQKSFTAEVPAFETLTSKYNFDNFDTTWASHFEAVGLGDEAMFREDILNQEVGTTRVYRHDSLYYVVTVTKKYDDMAQIGDHVKSLYLKDKYLDHINELARDKHVRVFEENIPQVSQDR